MSGMFVYVGCDGDPCFWISFKTVEYKRNFVGIFQGKFNEMITRHSSRIATMTSNQRDWSLSHDKNCYLLEKSVFTVTK